MGKKRTVLAIGGNAVNKPGEKATAENMRKNIAHTMDFLSDMILKDYSLIITHGNGPQVGNILIQQDMAKDKIPTFPLDVNVAQTQGSLGFFIAQTLRNELIKKGCAKTVSSIVTQVVVDPEDPAFKEPTKPVGPFYSEADGKALAEEKGWDFVEDSGRGWRRVVPSPKPLDIVEKDVIADLIEKDMVLVAAGGGGIPVRREANGELFGVEAVIDKDRASALLALEIEADELIILTGVDQVCVNFGKENEESLAKMTIEEAEKYLAEGQFPKGSMGPKIEAAVQFVKESGKKCLITSMETLNEALDGKTGTYIYKG
jgi:carbamate kinase